ncbi:acyl-CoA carboxylase subunit epsilon [Microbacterium marinilacus]|uniref:Acyl-CoA carboxylase subunit epsilon n=1 Tax=Microbacterium marinilacus TaxID=415209 RepID=A0ABP7BAZ5_9MICO|nr:acyl-CoA carboxylase subunit epsilon [Microbacterium marinilacus]MBY0687174.1 acyl-CoA carboxylase subunit epsilon [Microbacterium marinilacus]
MTAGHDPAAADDSAPAPRVEVVRGTPSEEELAALLAVVGEEYTRETEEAVADEARPSAWQLTRRRLRRPLRRDIPWGRFSG